MRTYKDVYQFPLHCDDIGWVRDAKYQFVFQFEFFGELLWHNILCIINGTEKPTKGKVFTHKGGVISDGKCNYIRIRGWGNLTGIGGHNMSTEEAANVQDTFAEFIVEMLNGNELNQKEG